MDFPSDWPTVAPPRAIAAGQTHVWAWRLDPSPGPADADTETLDARELERYHRFHFQRDRVRFAITHRNMRSILGAYLEITPSQISYRISPYGKPELTGAPLHFNLSHSRSTAVLAISPDTPLGVDVEDVKPIEPEVAEKYFSPREQAALAALDGDAWLAGFYRCWTRKEAILKAEGLGLNLPLSCFDVSLAAGEPAKLLDVRPPARFHYPWTLYDLATSAGTMAALATGSPQANVACFYLG